MSLDDDLAELEATDATVRHAADVLDQATTTILSTSAQLRDTQQALAVSQQDLTRIERELHDALRRAADLEQVREELRQLRLSHEGCFADYQQWNGEKAELIDEKLTLKADLTRAETYRATLERALSDADAKAQKLAGFWQECSRNRDEITAERDQWKDAAEAARADRDAVSLIADMLRAELTSAQQELARLRGECAYKPLAVTAMQERDLARAQLDDTIARFVEEAQRLHGLLAQARAEVFSSRDWAVADRDVGPCAACDRPIVRGQAFMPLADAKGYWTHLYCPDLPQEN